MRFRAWLSYNPLMAAWFMTIVLTALAVQKIANASAPNWLVASEAKVTCIALFRKIAIAEIFTISLSQVNDQVLRERFSPCSMRYVGLYICILLHSGTDT